MFTFCRDFEAATLKLPPSSLPAGLGATANGLALPGATALGLPSNSDLNAYYYGSQTQFLDPSASFNPYQDPTNPSSGAQGAGSFGLGGSTGNPAARRQIIGFAKFRTRQAALDARDALQGRKVDVDRASVLKAEMAKKNLHTRRGVGGDDPPGGGAGGPGGAGLVVGPSMSLGLQPAAGPSGLARGRSDGYPGQTGPSGYPGSEWSTNPSGPGGGHPSGQPQPSSTANGPQSRSQSHPYSAHPADVNLSRGALSSESSESDPSSPRYAPSSSQTETPMPPTQQQFDHRQQSADPAYPLFPPGQHPFPLSSDSPRFTREDELVGSPPSAAFSSSFGSYNYPRTRSLSRPQQSRPARRGFDLNGSGLAEDPAEVFSDGENESGEGRFAGGFDPNGGDMGPGSAGSSLGRAAGDKAGRTLPRTSNPADMNPPVS